jgi:hypothetical protein
MRQLSHVPQAHWSRTPGSPGAFTGKEFMAQLPHSRGAKRRENARLTRRRWRVAVEAHVGSQADLLHEIVSCNSLILFIY